MKIQNMKAIAIIFAITSLASIAGACFFEGTSRCHPATYDVTSDNVCGTIIVTTYDAYLPTCYEGYPGWPGLENCSRGVFGWCVVNIFTETDYCGHESDTWNMDSNYDKPSGNDCNIWG